MTEWFVRPESYSGGSNNGTSYANAWRGLPYLVWGGSGVVAGDTLWMCGCHYWDRTGTGAYSQQPITASGTPGKPITIRGDYPTEAGEFWSGYRMSYGSWTNESGNVWSKLLNSNHYGMWFFEDVSLGSRTLLDRVNWDTDEATTIAAMSAGTHASENYNDGTKLYVWLSDNGDPNGGGNSRVWGERFGYRMSVDNRSYITFKNLDCYTIYRPWYDKNANDDADHITWDGCRLWYGEGQILLLHQDADYFYTINCDMAYGKNAVGWSTSVPGQYATGGGIIGCKIHDFGNSASGFLDDGDSHAAWINAGDGITIADNECWNCGHTIILYAYLNSVIKNSTISRNFCHSPHTTYGVASPRGIALNGDGDMAGDKSGNVVVGNLVSGSNYAIGIRNRFENYLVKIYNNVVYGADYNYSLHRNEAGMGQNVEFKNNISLSPQTYHVYMAISALGDGDYTYIFTNNDYYPASGDCFYFYDTAQLGPRTWTEWKAISRSGCTWDTVGSIITDPDFENAGGSYVKDTDFKLSAESPCLEAGADVGLAASYRRIPIPQGTLPDIGPWERTEVIMKEAVGVSIS